MKKIFLTFLLVLSLTLSTIIGVNAAPVYDDFDFTVYDNEKYDLITGFTETDINYSRTNKIHLDKILIDDEVVFSHDDFHHVLFFNEFNAYIGYVNTNKSDLQLSTWIDGDVGIDGVLSIPDGVDKIALMNYNYEDTRNLIIYENEDIDNIAWDSLSYRDIFEGTQLTTNGNFEDSTSTPVSTLNLFDIDSTTDIEGITFEQLDVDSFRLSSTDEGMTYPNPFTSNITWQTETAYTFSGYWWEGVNGDWMYFTIHYDIGGSENFGVPNETRTYFEFTSDDTRTITEISIVDWCGACGDYTYVDEFQIEIGAVASDYIAYEVNTYIPDDWFIGNNLYGPTLTAVNNYLDFYGVGSPSATLHNWIYQTIPIVEDDYYYIGFTAASVGATGNLSIGFGYTPNNFLQNSSYDYQSSITQSTSDDTRIAIAGDDGIRFQLDDLILYNLTDIFSSNLPDIDEFETMKLYYFTYKDAIDEISYNDIYSNNVISNSDFKDGTTDWSSVGFGIFEIINERLHLVEDSVPTSYFNHNLINDIDVGHDIYLSFDIEMSILSKIRIWYGNDKMPDRWYDAGITYDSFIYTPSTFDFTRFRPYLLDASLNDEIFLDNVNIYDLTTIFGYVEDEIDTDWIELYYLTWLDPLDDNYTVYYPAANLITLDIDYSWDDTPAADPDAITSIDEGLVKMGVLTDELKVFLAFAIMIVLAIFIGLSTHNSTFIILGEAVLIIIFTMLGWFSFWILLLMALIFTLLILRNGLKGGNNE